VYSLVVSKNGDGNAVSLSIDNILVAVKGGSRNGQTLDIDSCMVPARVGGHDDFLMGVWHGIGRVQERVRKHDSIMGIDKSLVFPEE